jgi:hypothetical protein
MIKKEITWYKPLEKYPESEYRNGKEYMQSVLLIYVYKDYENPLKYVLANYFDELNNEKHVWIEQFKEKNTYLKEPDYWSYLSDSYPW